MNVDVENIASKKKWRPIYEVIYKFIFYSNKNISNRILDQYINNLNNPQNITSEVKEALKKWLWNRGYMHKWL